MEIHHHAKAPPVEHPGSGSHTRRKRWHHYFWEFLILFLAVTLGFFVENQREHYVERLRAKEYAFQLIEGLMKDTANLNSNLIFHKRKSESFDSLIYFFSWPGLTKEKLAGIYRHLEIIEQRRRYNATTVTFDQVINSGTLRYFKSRNLVNKILSYKSWIEVIGVQEEIEINYLTSQVTPFVSKHFERNLLNLRFRTYIQKPGWNRTLIGHTTPGRFLNPSPDLMTELENMVIKAREVFLLPAGNKEDQLDSAIMLIDLLKKEYHLSERTP